MDFGSKLKSKDKYHSNKRSSSDGRYFYVYGIPLIQEGIGKMSLASKFSLNSRIGNRIQGSMGE